MKRLLLALAFAGAFGVAPVMGQTPVLPYTTPSGAPNAGPVTATNPLPTACISGCSAAGGTGANNADSVAAVGTGLGLVQSYPFLYNGTTFDRAKGDATSGMWINCKAGCAGGTASNASDGVATSSTNGQTLNFPYLWNGATFDRWKGDTTSGAWVNVKSSVLPTGAAQGAMSTAFSLVAAATTNSTSVKASAGTRGSVSVYSISSTAVAWLKIYDTATAPTCGSGTPKERHLISYGASGAGGGAVIPADQGLTYTNGIGICITGGIADADTTAVAASTFVVNMNYR